MLLREEVSSLVKRIFHGRILTFLFPREQMKIVLTWALLLP